MLGRRAQAFGIDAQLGGRHVLVDDPLGQSRAGGCQRAALSVRTLAHNAGWLSSRAAARIVVAVMWGAALAGRVCGVRL